MPNFKIRSHQKELMDGLTDPSILSQNYQEIERVNLLLGGYQTLLSGIGKLADYHLLNVVIDVGCGAGDNIAALLKWSKQKNIPLHIIGLDLSETACKLASTAFSSFKNVEIVCTDYRNYVPKMPVHIICSSLFNHHLNDAENLAFLKWGDAHAINGIVINDLHRHPIAYYFIKYMAVLLNTSVYFKNDAPLSVLRAFKKRDWETLSKKSGLKLQVSWKWAFRWLIIYKK